MLEKEYKFSYNNFGFIWDALAILVFTFGAFLFPSLLARLGIEFRDIGSATWRSLFVGFFGGIFFLYPLSTNRKGLGILHDDYVEIHLGHNIHQIQYADITTISYCLDLSTKGYVLGKGHTWEILHMHSGKKKRLTINQARPFALLLFPNETARSLREFMDALERQRNLTHEDKNISSL